MAIDKKPVASLADVFFSQGEDPVIHHFNSTGTVFQGNKVGTEGFVPVAQVSTDQRLYRRGQGYQSQCSLSYNCQRTFRSCNQPCNVKLSAAAGGEWLTVEKIIKGISRIAPRDCPFRVTVHD